MGFKTERQQANLHCENIRTVLKESHLNYRLTESPFSIYVTVSKTFVKERSSSQMFVPSSTLASNISPINSAPCTPFPVSLESNQDSGFQNEQLLNDVRKELIKTTLESKQEITKLNDELIKCKEKLATHEKDIESKTTCITKLKLEKGGSSGPL